MRLAKNSLKKCVYGALAFFESSSTVNAKDSTRFFFRKWTHGFDFGAGNFTRIQNGLRDTPTLSRPTRSRTPCNNPFKNLTPAIRHLYNPTQTLHEPVHGHYTRMKSMRTPMGIRQKENKTKWESDKERIRQNENLTKRESDKMRIRQKDNQRKWESEKRRIRQKENQRKRESDKTRIT